jgi:uroporphyrinogen decarboxylase
MWRTWLKPRLARTITAARAVRPDVLVFYHSDGDVTAIIPDLIEIGVDILNPIQPECMDPVALKRAYGERLSFWGTIGTQSTFPFGSPEDVRREVRARIATVGVGGGLFLAPTHVIEPEVPFDNIVAFVEAVREA